MVDADDLAGLRSLRELRMEDNSVKAFKFSVQHNSKLRRILLGNNRIVDVGSDFLIRSAAAGPQQEGSLLLPGIVGASPCPSVAAGPTTPLSKEGVVNSVQPTLVSFQGKSSHRRQSVGIHASSSYATEETTQQPRRGSTGGTPLLQSPLQHPSPTAAKPTVPSNKLVGSLDQSEQTSLAPNLLQLSFVNNPCTRKVNYRSSVLGRCPNLKVLDGAAVIVAVETASPPREQDPSYNLHKTILREQLPATVTSLGGVVPGPPTVPPPTESSPRRASAAILGKVRKVTGEQVEDSSRTTPRLMETSPEARNLMDRLRTDRLSSLRTDSGTQHSKHQLRNDSGSTVRSGGIGGGNIRQDSADEVVVVGGAPRRKIDHSGLVVEPGGGAGRHSSTNIHPAGWSAPPAAPPSKGVHSGSSYSSAGVGAGNSGAGAASSAGGVPLSHHSGPGGVGGHRGSAAAGGSSGGVVRGSYAYPPDIEEEGGHPSITELFQRAREQALLHGLQPPTLAGSTHAAPRTNATSGRDQAKGALIVGGGTRNGSTTAGKGGGPAVEGSSGFLVTSRGVQQVQRTAGK